MYLKKDIFKESFLSEVSERALKKVSRMYIKINKNTKH